MRNVVLVFSVVAISGGQAFAGGLFVPGAGPHAQARAGAFVARADDPTALFHNPAGFAKLDGTQIYVGANLVDYDLTYQRTGRYEPIMGVGETPDYIGRPYPAVHEQSDPSPGIGGFQAIPILAASTDLGHPEWPVRFGFGALVPQAYAVRTFAERVDAGTSDSAPGPQRYDIIRQDPKVVQPSLVAAYSPLKNLDVGLRLSWGVASIEGKKAVWAVRNYEDYEGQDGVFTLSNATDYFIPSFGLGLLYRPTPWLEVGAAYGSKAKAHVQGTGSSEVGDAVFGDLMTVPVDDQYARCAPGGTPGHLKACLDLTLPQLASAGARWILRDARGGERADVEVDLRWENWSAASNQLTVVDAKNSVSGTSLNEGISRHYYQDVLSTRLGGSYQLPVGADRLILRAGAAYDTATAPDRSLRVDIDGKARTTLTAGVAFDTGRYRFDVGGGVVLEPTVTVEQCQPPDGPSLDNPGCDGSGEDQPVRQRDQPDPLQPTQGPFNQVESPYNAGRYESGYLLLSAGVTARF